MTAAFLFVAVAVLWTAVACFVTAAYRALREDAGVPVGLVIFTAALGIFCAIVLTGLATIEAMEVLQ